MHWLKRTNTSFISWQNFSSVFNYECYMLRTTVYLIYKQNKAKQNKLNKTKTQTNKQDNYTFISCFFHCTSIFGLYNFLGKQFMQFAWKLRKKYMGTKTSFNSGSLFPKKGKSAMSPGTWLRKKKKIKFNWKIVTVRETLLCRSVTMLLKKFL